MGTVVSFGSVTQWIVDLIFSLVQRLRRSATLTKMVPGMTLPLMNLPDGDITFKIIKQVFNLDQLVSITKPTNWQIH